jgi:very-short-patch-repair endonuclease
MPALRHTRGTKTTGNAIDRFVAGLADLQHGIVTRRSLLAAGIGRRAINHRIASGRLHPVHRGVYVVGHWNLSADGRRMAAVLAAGPGAVLSHRAAGSLWGLWRSDVIEVTRESPWRPRARIGGHELPLPADEVTIERGIPVTTVPRTLFDLASVLPRSQVERAINEAEVRRLDGPLSLPDLLHRYPRRWGSVVVRAILGEGVAVTRSELEARFVHFLRAHSLPAPAFNAGLFVAGRWIECDCVWQDRRVVVELDGLAVHGTAAAFERDRARDRALNANGWRTVRLTWRQLHGEPEALAYDLRALFSAEDAIAPSRSTSHLPSVS